jgi:hypothetical protein
MFFLEESENNKKGEKRTREENSREVNKYAKLYHKCMKELCGRS